MNLHNEVFYHQSNKVFEYPSYEEILANCDLDDRHPKSTLGLWTTLIKGCDFAEYTYEVRLTPEAKVLFITSSKLRDLFYKEDCTVEGLRAGWKEYNMVYLDEMEQIFLKFDNIKFKRIS